jgi:hypothetical protein
MANQSNRINSLEKLRRSLIQRSERLQSEIEGTLKELEAVQTTIRLLKGFSGESETVAEVDQNERKYYKEFRGLTQVEGLIKLAKDSGENRFRMKDAKRILVGAGLVKSKKNANTILFTAIQRSEKFKRVAPGQYELILPQIHNMTLTADAVLKRA